MTMTTDALQIEVIDLSEIEAQKIWKKQAKRPSNFGQFLAYLNARSVGAAFDVACAKVVGADKSEEYAAEARHAFNEAGKERTAYRKLADKGTALDSVVKPDDAAGEPFVNKDSGVIEVQVAAPVLLRWKSTTHKEKRTVQDGNKKREIEIDVVDFLHGLIVATDSVKKRGPRSATTENVDDLAKALNPPDDAKEITLFDGRKATKSKAGHWRAAKIQTPEVTANGTATVSSDGSTAETPAKVAA